MESQPAVNKNSFPRFWPWLAVLLVLLFVGFIRFRLLDMPLERDEGEYAYAGQLILQGVPPYELAYNMKLPGTYYAYALGMAIFGQTAAGIHLTLLAANLLTIVFIFLLGRKLFGVTGGVVACASYGVLSVSPAVLGMAAHANHFVVLFAVPGTLLLWQAVESNSRKVLFFSGLLYGMAFLMKQQGILFIFFGATFLFFEKKAWRKENVTDAVKSIYSFGFATLLPFAAICLILGFAGVFRQFWFWTFTYAHAYVTEEPVKDGVKNLWNYLSSTKYVHAGFWILAIVGFFLSSGNKPLRRRFFFVLALFVFSFFATAMGFYFRRHYFILLLPAFSVLIGLAVTESQRMLCERKIKGADLIPVILFAAVVAGNISFQKNFFFSMSGNQVCRTIYRDFPFTESAMAADYIRTHSATNSRIAVVGSEPEIYFYAQRHSATGYIYTYALMEPQPYARKMQQEMIGEIESNKPEYLVWVGFNNSWMANPSSDPAIFKWFDGYSKTFYKHVASIGYAANGELILKQEFETNTFAGQTLEIFERAAD